MSPKLPSREERESGWAHAHPLSDGQVELIAERFRVLSEPTRIKLLNRLRDGEATVGELTEAIGTTEQNISKQLGILQRAGIVSRRKQGNFSFYAIADEGVFTLCEHVCSSLERRFEALSGIASGSAEAIPPA